MAEDPEAGRLEHMLRAIGVPDIENSRIVNGFVNIPQIRNDPNYLSHWLDTHIRSDKALKAYIPMIVQEVSGQSVAPVPLPGAALDGGSRYFAPRYPGYPTGDHWAAQYPTYYPSQQQDSEVTKQIDGLGKRLESMLTMIQEDRQSREREQREREQREREQAINSKMDKLQETILEVVRGRGSSEQSDVEKRREDQIAALFNEIKELRTDQQTQVLRSVLEEVSTLRQAVAQSKGETVGRSTEDLVHDLGPLALDKFDKVGERLQNELKGLREQMGPSLKESIERGVQEPRTIDEIEEQVSTENRIISLTEEPSNIEVVVEDNAAPAEEPAEPYARMPSRQRRPRRGREEGEALEEVPGSAIPANAS